MAMSIMKKTNFFLQFLNTFIVKLRICIAADTHIQFGGVVWKNLQTQRKGEAKVLLNKLCVCVCVCQRIKSCLGQVGVRACNQPWHTLG